MIPTETLVEYWRLGAKAEFVLAIKVNDPKGFANAMYRARAGYPELMHLVLHLEPKPGQVWITKPKAAYDPRIKEGPGYEAL